MRITPTAYDRRSQLASFPSGQTVVAAVLCGLLLFEPMTATARPKKVPAEAELKGRDRVLHALNRFTFGPRPGDVAAAEAMGLKRWFDLQLHPEKIEDGTLEAKLAQFPAMRLSIGELTSRYPGPQELRAMEAGKQPLPNDPTARVVAMDEMALYRMKKEQKADEKASRQQQGSKADVAMNAQARAGQSSGTDATARRLAGDKPSAAKEIDSKNNENAEAGPREGFGHEAAMAIVMQAPDQRYRSLLAMPPEELVSFWQSLKPKEVALLSAGMSPVHKETLLALPDAERMVTLESTQTRLLRDVYSDRQLEAVMTDFWLNHFNVFLHKNQQEPYLIPTYERETIRPYALGNFEELLVATAKSPAMLMYLDNWQSEGPNSQAADRARQVQQMRPNGAAAKQASAGLNENYGRELMELHTLGVGGGYTQADVTQVAKVFTGWTIDKPNQGGGFVFDERRHEPGPKRVLGKTIGEGGEREGLEVLHMLAASPATARFISTKLAVRFVSDTPPPALVDRMTKSFLASHGDIKKVLRTMFDAPEFWLSAEEKAKVKTPLEFVVSAVRAGGIDVNDGQVLVQSLDRLGMPLYGMQTPNGYSWMKDGWVSTGALVSRMNFALLLAGNRIQGSSTEWSRLLGEGATVRNASFDTNQDDAGRNEPGGIVAAKERRLETILLETQVSDKTRQAVMSQAGDVGIAEQAATQFNLLSAGKKGARPARAVAEKDVAPDDPQAAVMAGLLLGSPEFQRR